MFQIALNLILHHHTANNESKTDFELNIISDNFLLDEILIDFAISDSKFCDML
jgi:hypothetical protein